jgi:ornithine lipid ester-linked acyl 2-hydroxylase
MDSLAFWLVIMGKGRLESKTHARTIDMTHCEGSSLLTKYSLLGCRLFLFPRLQHKMLKGSRADTDATARSKGQTLAFRLGTNALRLLEPVFVRHSLIPLEPVLTSDQFDWIGHLEVNWPVIAAEAQQLLELRLPGLHEIADDQHTLDQDDKWKAFFLYGFGVQIAENCARCPMTDALISRIPGLVTAFFSVLEAGKHIPAHRGAFRGIVRYHLGLIVPREIHMCRMRIGEQVHNWREGESILFDDTYEHEVWNDSEDVRVVLFIDVRRPLRFPASVLNHILIRAMRHSPVVRRARKRQMDWDYQDNPATHEVSS